MMQVSFLGLLSRKRKYFASRIPPPPRGFPHLCRQTIPVAFRTHHPSRYFSVVAREIHTDIAVQRVARIILMADSIG